MSSTQAHAQMQGGKGNCQPKRAPHKMGGTPGSKQSPHVGGKSKKS